jgi:hypothetical protein
MLLTHRSHSTQAWTGAVGNRRGFALVAVLVLLAALYLGATGIFLAARAELRIGVSHAASSQAFYLAEAGLATWLASGTQPSVASWEIGNGRVTVHAVRLIQADSVTTVYRIAATASVGSANPGDPGIATRQTSLLGLRLRTDPVRPIDGSWREIF